MTTPNAQDLAALLGSRICHDLISPIGAISNGVELLEMSGGGAGPEMELIAESVKNANARIRFFRVAFGAASAGQRTGASEITSILDDYTAGSRLQIDWQAAGDQSRMEVKAAFLTLMCLESAMPWGGEITVKQEQDSWMITGVSERMKVEQDLWHSLLGAADTAEVRAAEVQFLLLPLLLDSEGRSLALDVSDTRIAAQF